MKPEKPLPGAYYDEEHGVWFYHPRGTLWARVHLTLLVWRLYAEAWLARKWPRVFNRNGDMF